MSKQDDRSEAALRERLEIAGKATKGPWYHVLAAIVGTRERPDDNDATCICFTEWGCSGDPQANAAHIAASSPDVVCADLEEILRLRAEVARLNKEADWLAERLHGSGYPCPGDGEKFDPYGECRERGWPCVPCFREEARKAVEEEENG